MTQILPIASVARRMEVTHRPKEVLDLKGLIMHAYHGARDPNAVLASDGHSLIKRAAHGVEAFWNATCSRSSSAPPPSTWLP